jgi:hypothetical protein
MVGRPPWSAADAPVGLLALCMMLIPLARQRDGDSRAGGLFNVLAVANALELRKTGD